MAGEQPSGDVWTVGRLLTWTTDWLTGRGSESPRLDAEVLLAFVRGCPRIALYTAFDVPVNEEERARFRGLVKRRGDGEPVAYLVALCQTAGPAGQRPRIIDVGTGSGAIVVTLAKRLPQAEFVATDISSEALAVARDNAKRHGVADRIEFVECDLLGDPRAAGPWDVIVSNPPYVREDEFDALPRDVRLHEPRTALVAGPTGVEVIGRLAAAAAEQLVPGGWLLVEVGPSTAAAAEEVVAAQAALSLEPTLKDMAALPRIVQARRRV
jgi:release factor glutamine methyltransferase